MLERNTTTQSDPDLPWSWQRVDEYTWKSAQGQHWRHVRRRDLRDLTPDEWQRAMLVLRRPARGWQPCGSEGTFLGNLLHDLGPTSAATVLLIVRWWDEEPEQYVIRAVRDKRAHLALLVPVGQR